MDYKSRLQRLRFAMEESRLDALLVTHLPNVRYLCGFSGTAGALLVSRRQVTCFTDGRYKEQAREEVHGAKVAIVSGKSAFVAAASSIAAQTSIRRLGLEGAHLSVSERGFLVKSLPRVKKLVEAPPIVERLRMIKDPTEIQKISDACHLGVRLFNRVLEVLQPGILETEIAGELEFAARKAGVEQMAFPTILASGNRSALPHARASAAAVSAKGFVVCDFGVILAGYCSDMTRTVSVGRPSDRERAVYEAVREAQQAALEAVRPGATAASVDSVARKSLKKINLARFFIHSTGHGLGLEVHEAPRIAAEQTEPLVLGMVVTIEPGVYMPGEWGVRIEDTVVVTETGCEILTPCSKELIAL